MLAVWYLVIYVAMELIEYAADFHGKMIEKEYEDKYGYEVGSVPDLMRPPWQGYKLPEIKSRGISKSDPRLYHSAIRTTPYNQKDIGIDPNIEMLNAIIKTLSVKKEKDKKPEKVEGLSTLSKSRSNKVKISNESKNIGGMGITKKPITLLSDMRESSLNDPIDMEGSFFGSNVIKVMRDTEYIKDPLSRWEAIENLFDGKGYRV